jgi:hypothetical protein
MKSISSLLLKQVYTQPAALFPLLRSVTKRGPAALGREPQFASAGAQQKSGPAEGRPAAERGESDNAGSERSTATVPRSRNGSAANAVVWLRLYGRHVRQTLPARFTTPAMRREAHLTR